MGTLYIHAGDIELKSDGQSADMLFLTEDYGPEGPIYVNLTGAKSVEQLHPGGGNLDAWSHDGTIDTSNLKAIFSEGKTERASAPRAVPASRAKVG